MVLGEVDRERPQAQDVGAIVAHQVDRADRVAERLRHFEALGIHGEAMREDGLIRRLSARAAARSEEHTSELPSLLRISYAVFCLKKTTTKRQMAARPQTIEKNTTK